MHDLKHTNVRVWALTCVGACAKYIMLKVLRFRSVGIEVSNHVQVILGASSLCC